MLNTFSFIVVLTPLAIYWLLIGLLHLLRRPFVLSGGRETATLGLSMVGLVLIGPAKLFFPDAAYNLFGPSVWILIGILYLFFILFCILNSRPRIIVYGVDPEHLTRYVSEVLNEIDSNTDWLRTTFHAKKIGVEAIIEPAGVGLQSQIAATGTQQNILGWISLERALRRRLVSEKIPPRSAGYLWIAIAMGILILVASRSILEPEKIADGLRELFKI